MIIANKCDLDKKREVSEEEGQELGNKFKIKELYLTFILLHQ